MSEFEQRLFWGDIFNIRFEDVFFFVLLLCIPVVFLFLLRFQKKAGLSFSSFSLFEGVAMPRNLFAKVLPLVLRFIVLLLVVVALARPQTMKVEEEFSAKGIDIILAIDSSGSMKAEDFQPENRLEVAKEEAKKFIVQRSNDRIGLVVFAQSSITQCPLTLDYGVLTNLLDEVQIGIVKDGTAIGLALATATNRLRDSGAKSKVIILLTDGANNSGEIDPITAAKLAQSFDVKCYTIGIGKGGLVPFPIDDPLHGRRYSNVEVPIDEETLMRIAKMTGGKYFRARDREALEKIYEEINTLEKSEIHQRKFVSYCDVYQFFLVLAILLLCIELYLREYVFLIIE